MLRCAGVEIVGRFRSVGSVGRFHQGSWHRRFFRAERRKEGLALHGVMHGAWSPPFVRNTRQSKKWYRNYRLVLYRHDALETLMTTTCCNLQHPDFLNDAPIIPGENQAFAAYQLLPITITKICFYPYHRCTISPISSTTPSPASLYHRYRHHRHYRSKSHNQNEQPTTPILTRRRHRLYGSCTDSATDDQGRALGARCRGGGAGTRV
jgi:hypothetical protein